MQFVLMATLVLHVFGNHIIAVLQGIDNPVIIFLMDWFIGIVMNDGIYKL